MSNRTADIKAADWREIVERTKRVPSGLREEFILWLTGYVGEMCVTGDVRAKDVSRAWRSALRYTEQRAQSQGPEAF